MHKARFASAIIIVFASLSGLYAEPLSFACDVYPPFQIQRGASLSGYSVDLIRAVADIAGISIKSIESFPWKRVLASIESASVDGVFSIGITEERKKIGRFPSEPLIMTPWVIWADSKSKLAYSGFESLKGKKIGVVSGYSYTPEFWSYIKTNSAIVESNDDSILFKQLSGGRVDFIVAEYGNGLDLLGNLSITSVKAFLDNPVKTDGLYLMFSAKRVDDVTVKKFDEALKGFKNTSQYKELYRRYFGQ